MSHVSFILQVMSCTCYRAEQRLIRECIYAHMSAACLSVSNSAYSAIPSWKKKSVLRER